MDASARARKLRLMAFDVDGVMTDGSIYYTDAGTELKAFNALDGAGLRCWKRPASPWRSSPGVRPPASNSGRATSASNACTRGSRQGRLPADHARRSRPDATAAGYMGDDVMDLGAMSLCGFAVAPANAHDAVLQRAHLVTRKAGGHGAVREACDFVLASQGRLDEMLLPWLLQ